MSLEGAPRSAPLGVGNQKTERSRNFLQLSDHVLPGFEGPVRDLVNLRLAWVLKGNRWTLRPNLEILNATNSAAPWNITFTSGPRFGFYNNIDTPRIARFGLIYEF